jgi:hypothetical protein
MLKFILILSFPLIAQASLTKYCQDIYTRIFSNEKVEYINDKVSIVYFPGRMHTEITVNGKLYNPTGGFSDNGGEESLYLRGSTFARFKIRVTEEELQNIAELVQKLTFSIQSCVSGACKPVNKFTGLPIPPPFNSLPILNAAYLGFLKTTGLHMGRIEKIEIQGPIKTFAAMELIPFAAPMIVLLTLGFANGLDDKKTLKIPIEIPLRDETPIELTTLKLTEERPSQSVIYEDPLRHYVDIFAAGKSGLSLGPTLGYLIGMLAASFVVGGMADKGFSRSFWRAWLAATTGSIFIFSFGLIGLSFFIPKAAILSAGLWPFLPGDILKNILAATLVWRVHKSLK